MFFFEFRLFFKFILINAHNHQISYFRESIKNKSEFYIFRKKWMKKNNNNSFNIRFLFN